MNIELSLTFVPRRYFSPFESFFCLKYTVVLIVSIWRTALLEKIDFFALYFVSNSRLKLKQTILKKNYGYLQIPCHET